MGVGLTLLGVAFLAAGVALVANVGGLGERIGHVAAVWGALFGDRSRLRRERRIATFYGLIISAVGAALIIAGIARL